MGPCDGFFNLLTVKRLHFDCSNAWLWSVQCWRDNYRINIPARKSDSTDPPSPARPAPSREPMAQDRDLDQERRGASLSRCYSSRRAPPAHEASEEMGCGVERAGGGAGPAAGRTNSGHTACTQSLSGLATHRRPGEGWCTHVHTYRCAWDTHQRVYTDTYTHAYADMRTPISTHLHTHAHRHVHEDIHTCTHAYTHMCACTHRHARWPLSRALHAADRVLQSHGLRAHGRAVTGQEG